MSPKKNSRVLPILQPHHKRYIPMEKQIMTELSYYPGCSLASTARENNESLIYLFRHLGFELIELEDWNCCGSSSAHSINTDIAFDLAKGLYHIRSSNGKTNSPARHIICF